ncbi:Serine carboxypeptidase family protein [Coccidioides posadasii C735 delta SOWgp]|uniref:Carboxypeptidase n=1 Tax=Coccidioides posadasii (strain C735) TaxID=222929 RepID=C5P8U4_COCP7|nr:Serine carboxypeptidase family protein [Coccidioides posadasii C735 delta SOWgp]EER26156.1 Serine carboxypeptidase family protein [Coccidioides posadasii C735 delta SOWgp]|eukprot:XP_003068301.1 Serine carboxypeptidase family protein [Coccidioides posadasii C735 delta SOWgp]
MRFKSRFVITLAVIMAVKGEPSPLPLSVDWGATAAPVPTSNGKSSLPGGKETISPIDASKYAVKSLPDAQPIPRSWAGRMSVPGAAPGNEMFFWLFEPEDKAYNDNLLIWLNGGPGCSSMIGAFAENGPLMFLKNMSKLERNPYSWTKLGHVLYIDQPVGTGLSLSSDPTPATNNESVTELFYSWIKQFYEVFPHLLRKRTHLMGESYAGIYIPYFADRILKHKDQLSINLSSVVIGNGAIGNNIAMSDVAAGAYLKEKARDLELPGDILGAFSQADHICGFDSILKKAAQYPSQGHFYLPSCLTNPSGFTTDENCNMKPKDSRAVLSSILNSTCYGQCATYSTAQNYIETARETKCFSRYNIKYNCNTPNPLVPLTEYLNRADVQAALNVLPSKSGTSHRFETCNQTIIDSLLSPSIQPTPPTESILPSILATYKIPIHIYQGQLDTVINHIAVELVLQNMTWNGKQGLQSRPSIPFGTYFNINKGESKVTLNGSEAGVWAYERGLSYHLFREAGHGVPRDQPEEMWHYVKNVVVGRWSGGFRE